MSERFARIVAVVVGAVFLAAGVWAFVAPGSHRGVARRGCHRPRRHSAARPPDWPISDIMSTNFVDQSLVPGLLG